MAAIFQNILEGITQMQLWELVAVIFSIAYLLLALKEHIWCWYCALISTVIYTALLWEVNLLMDSALQVYYLIMAVYGWWQWREKPNGNHTAEKLPIRTWGKREHLSAVLLITLASLTSGYFLSNHTDAAWPYVDSFTTWASVLTTYMVAKKILENWLYWVVIDGVAALVYFDRGLYFTALLFVAYVIIVVFGYVSWRKEITDNDYATA